MAKILMTAIVADIRNKLNGTVFSKNRYGAYIRTKVTPVNPQTSSQQNARNRLSTMSQMWRGLTETQRQTWINAGINFQKTDIFGNPKIPAGNALFVSLNANLALVNVNAIVNAPLPLQMPQIAITSLTAASGTPALSLVFTPGTVPGDTAIVVMATPQIAPGRNFVKSQYRILEVLDAADTSPANLLVSYTAANGTLVEDNKIFVKIFAISKISGQAGIPVMVKAVIGA